MARLLEIPAPLMLLVPHSAAETARRLRTAVSAEMLGQVTNGQISEYGAFGMSYQGLDMRLYLGSSLVDLDGFKSIFSNIDLKMVGSTISIALGGHVKGGEKVPAIVNALLAATNTIGQLTDAIGVVWQPAKTVSGFDYFSRAVDDYENGGVFPVIALVNFKKADDGGICSTGLDWLAGQELAVAASALSDTETMRRVVRVAHDLAVNGPVMEYVELPGIEDDEHITLSPAPGGVLKMQTSVVLA